jgi:hypothetical protein
MVRGPLAVLLVLLAGTGALWGDAREIQTKKQHSPMTPTNVGGRQDIHSHMQPTPKGKKK